MNSSPRLRLSVIEAIRWGFEFPDASSPETQRFYPRGPYQDFGVEVRRVRDGDAPPDAEYAYLLPYPTVILARDMRPGNSTEQQLQEALRRNSALEAENAHLRGLLNGTGSGPGTLAPTIFK